MKSNPAITMSVHASLARALRSLAGLFAYPTEAMAAEFAAIEGDLVVMGDAVTAFARFQARFAAMTHEQREEVFTASFDVTPACVPYLSIHLFGEENFKRGEFMAALNARYATAGFDAGGELPDHLTVLLRFAAGLGEPERRELTEFCLLGPLARMADALEEANPYRHLMDAVIAALRAAYPGLSPVPSPLEQMKTHGASCASKHSGCRCGPIPDGMETDAFTLSPNHF